MNNIYLGICTLFKVKEVNADLHSKVAMLVCVCLAFLLLAVSIFIDSTNSNFIYYYREYKILIGLSSTVSLLGIYFFLYYWLKKNIELNKILACRKNNKNKGVKAFIILLFVLLCFLSPILSLFL